MPQLQTDDKVWSCSLKVGKVANNLSMYKIMFKNVTQGLGHAWILWHHLTNRNKHEI